MLYLRCELFGQDHQKSGEGDRVRTADIQEAFQDLTDDLVARGPVQAGWPNYSKFGKDKYHCHLAHKWVACWTTQKGSIIIEVYYAGSRENAPY